VPARAGVVVERRLAFLIAVHGLCKHHLLSGHLLTRLEVLSEVHTRFRVGGCPIGSGPYSRFADALVLVPCNAAPETVAEPLSGGSGSFTANNEVLIEDSSSLQCDPLFAFWASIFF
jgi:hypothetical protein